MPLTIPGPYRVGMRAVVLGGSEVPAGCLPLATDRGAPDRRAQKQRPMFVPVKISEKPERCAHGNAENPLHIGRAGHAASRWSSAAGRGLTLRNVGLHSRLPAS